MLASTTANSAPAEATPASKLSSACLKIRNATLVLASPGPPPVVVMIEMIFLLSVFAEIYTTTGGGPGDASTNVAFLIFKQALLNFDAGVASAGALFAVLLANIAAVFLIRMVGKNLDK